MVDPPPSLLPFPTSAPCSATSRYPSPLRNRCHARTAPDHTSRRHGETSSYTVKACKGRFAPPPPFDLRPPPPEGAANRLKKTKKQKNKKHRSGTRRNFDLFFLPQKAGTTRTSATTVSSAGQQRRSPLGGKLRLVSYIDGTPGAPPPCNARPLPTTGALPWPDSKRNPFTAATHAFGTRHVELAF